MENSDEKEQRRKKIKELEASLFGAENQWTTFSTNTDLPELKNVNEYASSLATVQTTKHSRQKTAHKAPQKKKKSTSLMQTITRKSNPNAKTARRRDENGFDAIPLIDDTDEEDYDTVREQNQPRRLLEGSRRSLETKPSSSSSIKMLKSEVEQLDEAFGKIFNDEPQQSVIDNLKKKHGLLVNDNKDYERFDALGTNDYEKTNVDAFHQKMNRARILDNVDNEPKISNTSRLSNRRLERLEQPELSVIGQALPSSSSTASAKPKITIDPSPKQKRSISQIKRPEKNRLSEESIRGLISYAHLERIPSQIDKKSGYEGIDSNFDSTFDQMPTNTFTDLQTSQETFANMSTDVFDQIPRAVTAREEKRLLKFQERLLHDKRATEKEENMEEQGIAAVPKQVSFIAALFKSTSGNPAENSTEGEADTQMDPNKRDDFLFALFIAQEPDPQLLSNEAGSSSAVFSNNASSLLLTSNGGGQERENGERARSRAAREIEEETAVGHFCAPFSPGFCEANFCIFHNPRQVENE